MSKLSPEMQTVLAKYFPPLEVALQSPEDHLFMNVPLAMVIGQNESLLLTSMCALSEKHIVTNQLVLNCFKGIFSEHTIKKVLKRLIDWQFIQVNAMEPLEVCQILKSKNIQGQGIGNKVCEWCRCNTFSLSSHHYPKSRKDSGKSTVNICSNCHTEYHYLVGQAGKPQLYHYDLNEEKIVAAITSANTQYKERWGYYWKDRFAAHIEREKKAHGGASGELTPGNGVGPRKALSERGERINGHLRRIK